MGQALTEHDIEAVVREVTDEEVAHYHEYGWVMMKQLVDPEFATELLSIGQAWLEENDEEKRRRDTNLAMQEKAEPFRSFVFSQRMSRTSVLELSSPFHYQPGDCTVHHGYTIHGAPVNTTDKSRWSFLFSYSPSDTRYWNGTAGNWGNDRTRLSDEQNPMLYFPDFEEV